MTDHPYYDSEKKRRYERYWMRSLQIFAIVFGIAVLIAIPTSITWENNNKVPVWVQYEVKILDKDKVVFYKSHDVSDSLVFKCNTDIFLGTQAIEKLEYRLP